MTPERLQTLITTGETLNVEFKGEGTRAFADRELVEAVACMANRRGEEVGWVIVGVEDNGTITGARPRHEAGQTDPSRVQALLANLTRPSLTCRVEIVQVEDKSILVVQVPPSSVPIGTSDGRYQRRALTTQGHPECVPLHFHEMQAMQADRHILDYTALQVPDAQWDDLDPLEFERYRRMIRENPAQADSNLVTLSDLDLAKALGAVEANHTVSAVRVLGLLLFGKEAAVRQFLPTHEVAFQVLSGTTIVVNAFLRWPLLRVVEELLTRFHARQQEEELLVGAQRIGIPDYADRAFREGVANALIHRDYTRTGAVHIQWFADRLEISNPGGFPEGVRLENLLVTPPRPRNPLLADACKRAGLVERTARGIDTIFAEQLRTGRDAPSYARSTERDVVLVIPGGKANLAFVRLVTEASQHGQQLGLDELLVLHELQISRQLSLTTAGRLVQKPESEARSLLNRLEALGWVEGSGESLTRTYHLTTATGRRLATTFLPSQEQRGERVDYEQVILEAAVQHGSMTRQQVALLCRVSPYQATRILGRLVKEDKLQIVGKGRGTKYLPRI